MPVFERSCPAMTPRADVYKVIDGEREYQQTLPPNRSEDPTRRRTVAEYLTMMDHYVRHAQDAWTMRAGIEYPLNDMRKIAALAVRCMEEWGALPRTPVGSEPELTFAEALSTINNPNFCMEP